MSRRAEPVSDLCGSAVTRCRNCGHVGNRTFARDANGDWRDVLGGSLGVRPQDCICTHCDAADFEMVPVASDETRGES